MISIAASNPYQNNAFSLMPHSSAPKIHTHQVEQQPVSGRVDTSPVERVAVNPTVPNSRTQLDEKTNQAGSEQEAQQAKDAFDSVIAQLKARDSEVRAHEMAHKTAGGQYVTGGPTYQYQTGPDGKQYAVGGEVSISTSPIDGDPEATIEKAMIVQRAALAPAEPSAQDYRVASEAMQMMVKARQELAQQTNEDKSPFSEAGHLDGE